MKSTQILVAGLILMVVLNICTLGFIIYKSQQHKHFQVGRRNGEEHYGGGPGGHGGPGKFLSKKLNLTPEQEAKLEEIRKPHEEKMAKLRALKDSLRKQAFQLVTTDPYDSIKANAVANEIGNCHKEMEEEMVTHFRAIKALCTKEQQADFNEFIEHISNEKMHGNGRMQGGEGHGGMRRNDYNRHFDRRRHGGGHHHHRKNHNKGDCKGRGDQRGEHQREGHQRGDNQKRDGQGS